MASCLYGRYTRTCTADGFYTDPFLDKALCGLATKIRLREYSNDYRMEKNKTMAAVRSKRKLLHWKQETGEIRTNRCNILG